MENQGSTVCITLKLFTSLSMHSNEHCNPALLLPPSQTPPTFSASIDSARTRTVGPTDNFIKRRHRLASTELAYLNQAFAIDPLPNTAARQRIAAAVGMSEKAVQTWFQNRRAKKRRDDAVKGPTLVYSRTTKDAGQMNGIKWDGGLLDTIPQKNAQECPTSLVTMNTLDSDTKHIEDWLEQPATAPNEMIALQGFQLKHSSMFELPDEKSFELFRDFSNWLC